MKYAILLLWCFCIGALTVAAQTPALEKRQVFEGRVEVLVPSSFTPMTAEMLALKYPAGRPPQQVFTDERGATNVAFSLTATPMTQANLPAFEQYMYATMQKAQPQATWYSHGMRLVNDRQLGYLELLTPAADTEVYNLMFFTDLDGRLLLMTFNCVKKDMALWKDRAQEILQSVSVVKAP